MSDDDKKWLYVAGAGLLLTVVLMNLKPKPTKKPPSISGDGTGDGTGDPNPPVTQPPDTNPPDTNPPDRTFPNTMPTDKGLLFQKNLEFFLSQASGAGDMVVIANKAMPLTGRFDKYTYDTFEYLRQFWIKAADGWRDWFFLLTFFDDDDAFSNPTSNSDNVSFNLYDTGKPIVMRRILYSMLTNMDMKYYGAQRGFYTDRDKTAYNNATTFSNW
jgi:hypothetical protein